MNVLAGWNFAPGRSLLLTESISSFCDRRVEGIDSNKSIVIKYMGMVAGFWVLGLVDFRLPTSDFRLPDLTYIYLFNRYIFNIGDS